MTLKPHLSKKISNQLIVTPNQLTIVRIIIALICPFLLIKFRSFNIDLLVMFLFLFACFSDWLDGYIARKKSMVTNLGKITDPIADKLLILGLMFTFVYEEQYGIEWVLPIFIREVTVTTARFIKLRQGKVIPAEGAGKVKMVIQIASVFFTLFYLILFDSGRFYQPEPYFLFVFNTIHYIGIFAAVLITVYSGIAFFLNYDE